jgi:RNA polymerase sigma-70 factor (ECF subfamily)
MTDVFDAARPRLRARAYRMLGVFADAEDVVQDAWLRWEAADHADIVNPDAWLNTVTSRLAIDRLRRRRREQVDYVGPWIPEPVVSTISDPAHVVELADSLTLGFMMMLERLSEDERVAFLMADVFDEPYSLVAEQLGRSEVACRQLASRGRRKMADGPAETTSTEVADATIARFVNALVAGDEAGVIDCLHADVELISDGGRERHAARRPVGGPFRVGRFLSTLAGRIDPTWTAAPADVGGLRGMIYRNGAGEPEVVIAFRVVDHQVIDVISILNPDKLSLVSPERLGE